MIEPPKRVTVVGQTASVLRQHFASRPAGEKLPGERELARQLGVSRPTLSAALTVLEREGLLRTRPQSGRTVVRARKPPGTPTRSHDVALLLPGALSAVEPRVLLWIDELREALAREAHQLQILSRPGLYSQRPNHHLEELAKRVSPSAWVLVLATRAIQEWFAARHLPAIIAGSRYDGVRLPCVDRDQAATCAHAVGRFAAKGHRRMALLTPQASAAGDLRSEAGFQAAGDRAGLNVETTVQRHDGTVAGLCGSLDRLLARERPPTAFLVAQARHSLTALGHLIQRGLRFPDNAAFIAREHDSFLDCVVPSVARYRIPPEAFAAKLSRVVLQVSAGGNPAAAEHLLIPDFIPGQTMG